MVSAFTQHMWAENINNTPVTHVGAAAGNVTGRIDDPINGHVATAPSDATRPSTYATGINSAYAFTSASNMRFELYNSTEAFQYFHQDVPGGVACKLNATADGSAMTWMDSIQGSGANRGIGFTRTSGNLFQFIVSKGGSNLYNYTTSSGIGLTVADGWRALVVQFNGASSYVEISPLTGPSWTRQTFGYTVSGAGSNAMSQNLTVGSRQSGAASWGGRIGHCIIWRGLLSNSDRDAWLRYDPAISTASLVRSTSSACGTNFCTAVYDFVTLGVGGTFQDTACSSAVTTPGQSISCVVPRNDSDRHLNRDAIIALVTEEPTYQTGYADFDGVNDNLDFAIAYRTGGGNTFIATLRNDDATDGSHIWTNGAAYWANTGDNYVGNPGGAAYAVLHTATGDTGAPALVSETGYNTISVRRNGSSWAAAVNGGTETSATESGSHGPARIGDAATGLPLWQLDGRVRRLVMINADIGAVRAAAIAAAEDRTP